MKPIRLLACRYGKVSVAVYILPPIEFGRVKYLSNYNKYDYTIRRDLAKRTSSYLLVVVVCIYEGLSIVA